jgi:hypothetical protein
MSCVPLLLVPICSLCVLILNESQGLSKQHLESEDAQMELRAKDEGEEAGEES